jgi:hypothetical protein
MGLAASQARMLLLVARKSDLEYRGQMINQRRMHLAWQTEALAKTYTDAMTNRTLMVKDNNNAEVALSVLTLNNSGYTVLDAEGDAVTYDKNSKTQGATVEAKLREGTYHLQNTQTKETVDWRSNTGFNDKLNTEDDEAAKATYEYESLKIQTQDKQLEIELKNVDTQHNAVQTECDAVKKVIEKNIESSFKTFG